MKRLLVVLGMAAFAVTLCAQPRERTPIVLEHANTLSVTEEGGVRRQELHGNVRITKDSLNVTCDNAVYYPDSGRIIFRDNVVFADRHRTLFADEVTYNEFTEQVDAVNHVRVYQQDTLSASARSARYFERLNQGFLYDDVHMREEPRRVLLTGKLGFLDHDRQYGRVTGDPVVTERDSLQKLASEIRGDTVEYFGAEKRIRVSGNVHVDRDSLIATGTSLNYLMAEHMAELTGQPEAVRGTDDVHGDTMRLFFEKERLTRVEVIGHAVATNPADSGALEPQNRMEGKKMTLWTENGQLSRALIEGTAIATYYVRDKSEKRGLNITSGDCLRVFFEKRKIARIRVEGGTEGIYTPERLLSKQPESSKPGGARS
jgi:lipopolysaccharide export system protein LptA